MSLEEAIARRRSVREFLGQSVRSEQVSQLLWAAQGTTDPSGYRAAPSAGALYPLETYLASPDGFYRYEPRSHRLEKLSSQDFRGEIRRAALDQEAIADAAAVFVIAAVYERTAEKYGRTRGARYAQLEAGHAAQNLLLQAVALGLGAVPIGAFDDASLKRVLSLPEGQQPLYVIPVGLPR